MVYYIAGPMRGLTTYRIYDTGQRPIACFAVVTPEDVQKLIAETDRIYRFRIVSYTAETMRAEIELIPDDGMRTVAVDFGE